MLIYNDVMLYIAGYRITP